MIVCILVNIVHKVCILANIVHKGKHSSIITTVVEGKPTCMLVLVTLEVTTAEINICDNVANVYNISWLLERKQWCHGRGFPLKKSCCLSDGILHCINNKSTR